MKQYLLTYRQACEGDEIKVSNTTKERILPFSFSIFVILADQISKFLVEKYIPLRTIKFSFFGDFLRIIHVTNTGAAFSMGDSMSAVKHLIVLCVVPLILLITLIVFCIKSDDFSKFQRWLIAGIVGGGFGNLIDRFFRPNGVVDFIDVKFYNLFGLERWPTFNIADSFVLVCIIILAISYIKTVIEESKAKKQEKQK